jgi:fatty acid desaturase
LEDAPNMSLEIMRDTRVRSVEWRDLVPLSRIEVWKQLLLPLPWVSTSILLAHYRLYIPALVFSFIFFLTGLRVVHDAYHYSLSISKAATEWVIYGLSFIMLGSMHAVQIAHLHHHKHCMDEEDVEAASALMPWWKAILVGPIFPFKTHRFAMSVAKPAGLRWIRFELLTTVVLAILAFGVFDYHAFRYHIGAMMIGQCLTSFFAVWTVHHDCDREHYIARTLRNPVKSVIAFEMFYHVEHHLFPKVPTCHLSKLSRRLDEAAPELKSKQVY